jgi:hypothetical protein
MAQNDAADEEKRGSPRRWVMLRVQLEDGHDLELVQTINVSETGILIERPPSLALAPQQVVSVVIEGLLPEEGLDDSRRQMEVVRVDEHVALKFVDSPA